MRRDEAYHRQNDNDDACSLTLVKQIYYYHVIVFTYFMWKKCMRVEKF